MVSDQFHDQVSFDGGSELLDDQKTSCRNMIIIEQVFLGNLLRSFTRLGQGLEQCLRFTKHRTAEVESSGEGR